MTESFGLADGHSDVEVPTAMLSRSASQDLFRSPVLDQPEETMEPALPETLAFPSTMENLVAVDTSASLAPFTLHAGHDAHALSSADQAILRHVHDLFSTCDLEPGSTIAITSPEHLASELFTERGRGTLVVRGEQVSCHLLVLV